MRGWVIKISSANADLLDQRGVQGKYSGPPYISKDGADNFKKRSIASQLHMLRMVF